VHPSRSFYGQDEALGLPALYSGAKLLADSVASLPLKIYTRGGLDGRAIRYRGPSVFDMPSVTGTTFDWLFTAMTSLVLQGNAWGFITGRDGYGYPTGIEWIPPQDVSVMDDEQQPWNPLRSRIYVYGRLMGRDELFHVKAFAVAGRTEGISPLRAFAMTILAGMEAQRYGTDWFRSGGFPPGTFQNSEIEIDADQAEEIREALSATIRRREPLVYGRDWDYKPVVVPPNEAQFIQAMQMNATQVAAILGLPPDRLGGTKGDSLTYSCVMKDTQILTTRGWLQYDQVEAGDTALTLNVETGTAEWQPVQSVHIYRDGPYPVTEFRSLRHSSATTGNHRWPVMFAHRAYGNGWAWRTTETMPWDARVAAAAPYQAPDQPKWSDALTELMAWFWTEGWIGNNGQVTITQSGAANPRNTAKIRAVLTELFGPDVKLTGRSLLGSKGWQKREAVRAELERDASQSNRVIGRTCGVDPHTVALVRAGKIDGPGWTEDTDSRQISHFRLNAQAGWFLTEHAPGKVVTTEFLSQLTRAQLELFYQVSVDADGTRRTDGTDGAVMAQKDRARLESFQVACALTGRAAVVRGPDRSGMYHVSIRVKPFVKPKGHARQVSESTADLVWCVQTPNKTWFARRDGTCYFTGNTVEQSTLQVIEALRPWLVRLEHAFFQIIPANRYTRFDSDALLKTDLKTRTEIYKTQRDMGLRNTDELRDLEDLEPLPGKAGGENIPLEVMVAMARSIRGIPNSMLSGITLEMDLAADRLEQLQKEDLAQPDTGMPSAPSADAMLGQLVGATRSHDPGERDDARLILDFLAARRRARRMPRAEPEYIGAWIPSKRELVLSGVNGHDHGGVNGRKSVMDVVRATWSGPAGTVPPERIAHARMLAGQLFGLSQTRDSRDAALSVQQYDELVQLIRKHPPCESALIGTNGYGRGG